MPTDRDDSTRRGGSTHRFLFSPRWIGFHLLIVVLVVTMVDLAFWQLRRLDERRQFNSNVRANASQPVAAIGEVDLSVADQSSVEWRRVRASGTYLTDPQFLVVNRAQNGDTGRNVVAALQLDDGALVLVNRGFVPIDDDVPPVPRGPVDVVGRLRQSERRRTGQPTDEDVAGLTEIHRIDVALLSNQFDAAVLPMYVEQLESVPPDASTLQPIVAPSTDEGPHLSYSIQWFIFSACVVVGWVLAVRRSIAIRSGKDVKKRKSSYVPIAEDESVG